MAAVTFVTNFSLSTFFSPKKIKRFSVVINNYYIIKIFLFITSGCNITPYIAPYTLIKSFFINPPRFILMKQRALHGALCFREFFHPVQCHSISCTKKICLNYFALETFNKHITIAD